MNHLFLYYGTIGLAVSLLGLSKGGFPGMGALATPLMAFIVGPLRAISLMLPVMVVLDIIAIFTYHASVEKNILKILLLGSFVGIFIAFKVLLIVSVKDVQILLGVISLVFVLQQVRQFLKNTPFVADKPLKPASVQSVVMGIFCGIASGFSSTVAHAGSPPFQLYVQPMGLKRDTYIGTSVFFFAIVNLLKVPVFLELGQLSGASLTHSEAFLPLAIFFTWVGRRLVRLVNLRLFNMIISLLLGLAGILLIFQAEFQF